MGLCAVGASARLRFLQHVYIPRRVLKTSQDRRLRIAKPLIVENISQFLRQKIHEDFRLQNTDFGFGFPGKIVPDTCGQRGLPASPASIFHGQII